MNAREAFLDEPSLKGADLRGAVLDGACLRGTAYDEATRWPPGFDPVDRGAVFAPAEAALRGLE